jgi:glycosyltransferase involved in cell wall biosynthesis
MKGNVAVVIPALNEEEGIGRTIDEVYALPIECDVIVVDNGSTDKTREIASAKGAEVICESRRGKGYAVRSAFYSLDGDCEYVVMIDADGTYRPKYIPGLIDELQSNGYDVVMGCRSVKAQGAMTKLNVLGNIFLTRLACLLYRTKIYDLCTGMWAFKLSALEGISVESKGFTLEAELFCKMVERGMKIGHVPIIYITRCGTSKLRVTDGLRIAGYLFRRRFNGNKAKAW